MFFFSIFLYMKEFFIALGIVAFVGVVAVMFRREKFVNYMIEERLVD